MYFRLNEIRYSNDKNLLYLPTNVTYNKIESGGVKDGGIKRRHLYNE